MEIKPVVASVVGKTSDTHWGQVLHLPHAYGVVEIIAQDAIARTRGVTILSHLTHALSPGVVSLKEISSIADEHMADDVATIAILVPVGKVVYLVLRGGGSVYIRRGEKFATLMHGAGSISGEVQPGDSILVASQGFTQSLSPDEVGGVFDHLGAEEVAQNLTLLLHEKQNGEGGAALVFQVSALVSADEQELVTQPESIPVRPDYRAILTEGIRRVRRAGGNLLRRARGEKRVAFTIGLIALFLVSVILGIRKQAGNMSARKADAVVAEAQHTFDEGMALMDLNAVKGRQRLSEAQALLAPIVSSMSERSPEGKKVHDLYALVTESISRAQHISRVSPAVFFDVALVKKDAKGSSMSYADGRVGLIDRTGRTIFDLTLATKNGQIAGGGEQYEDASHIAVYGDRLYVLVPDGIHMIRLTDRKTTPLVVKKDEGWGTIASLVAYGGNLYLLDTTKGRVWKYIATETGFSDRREYLNPDTLPDLSKGTSLAINGSVWVGMSDGKVSRFTQGKEQTYLLQGLDIPFGANIQVFTDDQQKYVYVLDSANKRIVALDKDGIYMAQYVWEGEFAPTSFAVSEEDKLIILLSGGTIYSVPME